MGRPGVHRVVLVITPAITIPAGGCGRFGIEAIDRDAPRAPDALLPCASYTPFGPPVNLGPHINSSASDRGPFPSADELTLYFDSTRPGGAGGRDLWVATRTSRAEVFGAPTNLNQFNTTSAELGPWLAADGHELMFTSDAGAAGTFDVYVAAGEGGTFGPHAAIPVLADDAVDEAAPSVSADGLTIYYARSQPANAAPHIARGVRATMEASWELASPPDTVNDPPANDRNPAISAGGMELFFESDRGPGNRIFVARRDTPGAPFERPVEVDELNTAGNSNTDPALSADGRTIYFASNRSGGSGGVDLWSATRGCATP